jgi:hypothetical protein
MNTFRDAVAEYLKARPHQWVDGLALAELGGAYAWRSRVSDARRELGMTIENRQRRVGKRVVSEYCYVPPARLWEVAS